MKTQIISLTCNPENCSIIFDQAIMSQPRTEYVDNFTQV